MMCILNINGSFLPSVCGFGVSDEQFKPIPTNIAAYLVWALQINRASSLLDMPRVFQGVFK
jgi:hypothetical protein